MQARSVVFAVGSPMSIFRVDLFLNIIPLSFTKDDFLRNLNSMSELCFFERYDDACDYARSLRIVVPQKSIDHNTPLYKQFAPVVQFEFMTEEDSIAFYKQPTRKIQVRFKEYDSITASYGVKVNNHERIYVEEVECIVMPKMNINLSAMLLNAAIFPDTDETPLIFDEFGVMKKSQCVLQ